MKSVVWSDLSQAEQAAVLQRPPNRSDPQLIEDVRGIIEAVRAQGWAAVERYSRAIDHAEPEAIEVEPVAEAARNALDPELVAAIELAASNIERFHAATKPSDVSIETMPGLKVSKVWRPVEHAGLYVPGGSAPLFSTLLMLAIPARAARVDQLTVMTPPRAAGGLDPAVALAAQICGLERVWTIGGAQAIAALAFGAGDIEQADLICGPGNAWVSAAKSLVASLPGGPRIDLPAGPSELMIIADESADACWLAADLLSQAEHDRHAQVILVTDSRDVARVVVEEIGRQLEEFPRAAIARAALETGRVILIDDLSSAISIANAYAPEHLSLALARPESFAAAVCNAGAIFLGMSAAESFGDYLAGSSHVLPTDGAARAWGGVSTQTFMKSMTVQCVSPGAVKAIARPAALMARAEGLEAHARAAEFRLECVA